MRLVLRIEHRGAVQRLVRDDESLLARGTHGRHKRKDTQENGHDILTFAMQSIVLPVLSIDYTLVVGGLDRQTRTSWQSTLALLLFVIVVMILKWGVGVLQNCRKLLPLKTDTTK